MLLRLAIYLTISLLVFTTKYRVLGIMYIQLWEIALIFCLLFWLSHIAITKKINIKLDSLNIALFVFLLINIFSSIRIPEHAGKFMEGGMWQNARTIEPFLLYLIISDHLASKDNVKPFLYCLLIVLFAESLLGILQSLGNIEWPPLDEELAKGELARGYLYNLTGYGSPLVTPAYGTFGHFNAFGAYLAVFVPLIISFSFYKTIINRRFIYLLAGLTIAGLLLTYSRAALLSIIVGLSIMFFIRQRNKPVILFIFFSFFIVATLAIITIFLSRDYQETLSFDVRTDIWKTTLQVIFSDPVNFIFGTGSGTYVYWTQFEDKGHFYTPHNSYIFFWLETGLLGLMSFLSICIISFVRSLKTYLSGIKKTLQAISFAMVGIIPSLLVVCFFSSIVNELYNKALFLIFISLYENTRGKDI